MNKPINTALKAAGWLALLFFLIVAIIIYLAVKQIITGEMALLMFVGMLGIYLGFGVMIAVYRFVAKLE